MTSMDFVHCVVAMLTEMDYIWPIHPDLAGWVGQVRGPQDLRPKTPNDPVFITG